MWRAAQRGALVGRLSITLPLACAVLLLVLSAASTGSSRWLTGSAPGGKKEEVFVASFEWSRNWGDMLNPVVIPLLGDPERYSFVEVRSKNKTALLDSTAMVIYGIGSILYWNMGFRGPQVYWGSGLLNQENRIPRPNVTIAGVRGYYTQKEVLRQLGRQVPVVGDPVVLLPRLLQFSPSKYRVTAGERFEVCFIPHLNDKQYVLESEQVQRLIDSRVVQVLDLKSPSHDPEPFLEALGRCQRTLSSSLHGIIASHAYGIRSKHAVFSNDTDLAMAVFKFLDYYSSVGLLQEASPVPLDVKSPGLENQLWYAQELTDHSSLPDMAPLQCALLQQFPLALSAAARKVQRAVC